MLWWSLGVVVRLADGQPISGTALKGDLGSLLDAYAAKFNRQAAVQLASATAKFKTRIEKQRHIADGTWTAAPTAFPTAAPTQNAVMEAEVLHCGLGRFAMAKYVGGRVYTVGSSTFHSSGGRR